MFQGMVAIVVGTLTFNAGTAFRQIVQTKGNDMAHLMKALNALKSVYQLQVYLVAICGILIVVGIALALMHLP